MSSQHVLVIGSGGREHALAWALAHSPQVGQVFVAPGNAGTAENVPIAVDDFAGLIQFARENAIDLTVVGPEIPLAAGIADAFQDAGLRIFGPSKAAARLEASKAFAKDFMQTNNIPTATYAIHNDYEQAKEALADFGDQVVVKADGLAAGKGVLVCENRAEAKAALDTIMQQQAFGSAGDQVVIEERLSGDEISVLAFCDGSTSLPMKVARDHKRALDGDQGLNTGGMGAFAPTPDVPQSLVDAIMTTVIQPTLDGMAARGTPYTGVLFVGLMLTSDGPKVLEFNCRFGDPETQVVLPLLRCDLYEVMNACIDGKMSDITLDWRDGSCATVVLASPGYPMSYPKGLPITGLEQLEHMDDVIAFHAGTALSDGQIVTAGGRVLGITALGADLNQALRRAHAAVDCVHFEGMHYRHDIGRTGASAR